MPTPPSVPGCDPVNGLCDLIVSPPAECGGKPQDHVASVHYVGDPMCSWCWGISPALETFSAYCRTVGIPFRLTVGGLRAGGGEDWTPELRDFLRGEWTHIHEVTSQPFSMKLLERTEFDYDTEPACRAVVAARFVMGGLPRREEGLLKFFSDVQRKFYVDGADPKDIDFYESPCEMTGIPFGAFASAFRAEEVVRETHRDFVRCRRMGVSAFPTVLAEVAGRFIVLGKGFSTAQGLIDRLASVIRQLQ